MIDFTPKCEVCGVTENFAGVAALPFGPMSIGYCRTCLAEGAYPLGMIVATIEMAGGVDQVADWFKELRAYKDGRYFGWDEIVIYVDPNPKWVDDYYRALEEADARVDWNEDPFATEGQENKGMGQTTGETETEV